MMRDLSAVPPSSGRSPAARPSADTPAGVGRPWSRRRALGDMLGLAAAGIGLSLRPAGSALAAEAARLPLTRPGPKAALIVVDVQNCFVDGGTLPVKGGADVVPVINRLAPVFRNVIITQDWHTPGHASFASTHAGRKPFESIDLAYGNQVLWPDHCVQGSDDAGLVKGLDLPTAQLIIRKGFHKDVDSYSAFEEADRKTVTGLAGYLKARGIDTVYLTGLATDFCVAWTAIDARKAGFQTYVIEDATRAIDLDGSLAKAWKDMMAAGVRRIQSGAILNRT